MTLGGAIGTGLVCAAIFAATACSEIALRPTEPVVDDAPCTLGTAASCGDCDDSCVGDTPVCTPVGDGFACSAECPEPLVDCGGRCVDLATNPGHCGECDNRCAMDNAIAECSGGECVAVECENGFADCNSDGADGCETPLNTEANCTVCGDVCADSDRCVAGACDACAASQPVASGSVTASRGICGLTAGAEGLELSTLVLAGIGSPERCESGGSLAIDGVTVTGTGTRGLQPLCRVQASGSTLRLTRLQRQGLTAATCDAPAGEVTIAGASVSGTASSTGGFCAVREMSGNFAFYLHNPLAGGCTTLAGVITVAPVCLDSLL